MRICANCKRNYALDGDTVCRTCLEQRLLVSSETEQMKAEPSNVDTPRVTPEKILSNGQLGGRSFERTLAGYDAYLRVRGYCTETPSGTISTVGFYVNAVQNIMEKEHMDFSMMLNNAENLIYEYGPEGVKRKSGHIGHDTWINALRRLGEFAAYLEYVAPKH